MAQPIWITPAGSLGIIPEGIFYQNSMRAYDPDPQPGTDLYYRVIAGTLPAGIQCSITGLIAGVPQAVASLQGVPQPVNRNEISKFTLRAYTEVEATGQILRIADRTFTLTVSGNDIPEFTTPYGSFATNNTAQFTGAINGTELTVSAIAYGTLQNGMVLRGSNIVPGTTIVGTSAAVGGTGKYTINISQSNLGAVITGWIGVYYDGDLVDLTFGYTSLDPDETIVVRKVSGEYPPGLTLSTSGRLYGYIEPTASVTKIPGYDETKIDTEPYDFIVAAISKNYQFTLEVTDGKSSNLRTFTIYVYNRNDLTADTTTITSDNTFVTADQNLERAPFLVNADPSDLGRVRSDNYFAYQFRGNDYDTVDLTYKITVNEGQGLPPGLTLDPTTGWYYGFIPDTGLLEVTYSFNIQVRQAGVVCTATTASLGLLSNFITCDSTVRSDVYVDSAIVFEGTGFGGISPGTTYYIREIISDTQFTISSSLGGPALTLATATGNIVGYLTDTPVSQLYPFSLTIVGITDSECTWITDADLGVLENGATSLLKVEAVNRGGAALSYRLKSGAFNELPQGLQLLSSGEIAGRVTFNTFSVDLGFTTFDKTQTNITGISETTFDSSFTFTVNAYAEDPSQDIYKVSKVVVDYGGTGYSSLTPPVLQFSEPVGADSQVATATAIVVGGAISKVILEDQGRGYYSTPTLTITESFGGSGAILVPVIEPYQSRDAISVFQTFTVRIFRAYNYPYQNLFCVALPPVNDRVLLDELLTDQEIFVPEYIYRPDDANFGVSTTVKYEHAYGLAPETIDTYVASLYLNHYWKNLILGSIETAQALDADGNIVYEVVYSKIIDGLTNSQGQSVSKIVNLPYAIIDPNDNSSELTQVYPNSLVNMRDQVIDVVGQISTKLPLWMTSKQTNGRILGFTPAWVICYANPGRSKQISYYISEYFAQQLNSVDFKVDRYVLDRTLSKNWDTNTQQWTPKGSLTTFDYYNTSGYVSIPEVQCATNLAYDDINYRTLADINALGGIDGLTWIDDGGVAPFGTKVVIRDGTRIIFVKQENYPNYNSNDNAWQQYTSLYDETLFDPVLINDAVGSFDSAYTISGGYQAQCTVTTASTDRITCASTVGMTVGDYIWFTGDVFGDVTGFGNNNKIYCVYDVPNATQFRISDISSAFRGYINNTMLVITEVFTGIIEVGITLLGDGIAAGTTITADLTGSGGPGTYSVDISQTVSTTTINALSSTPTQLTNDTGDMLANWGNTRMDIYEISIQPATVTDPAVVILQPIFQVAPNRYLTVTQGQTYNTAQLYRPTAPGAGLTLINWQSLITVITVIGNETTFDEASMQFIDPVDMYDTSDALDKYLVFPKSNILV